MKKRKRIMIIAIIVIVIIIGLIIYLASYNRKKEYTSVEDFSTVKEVLEYLGCNYIRTEKGKEEFEKDIYVEFNHDLYENNISNERFFNNLIGLVTRVNSYKSMRLIDQKREITIEIYCDTNNGILEKYTINGIEDYFSKQNSKENVENYQAERTINAEINSKEILTAIQNKWTTTDVNFGSKESDFENYEIYFEEGIEVRTVSSKIFNIVFNEKYLNSVINGIRVGTSLEEVEKILGEPLWRENDVKIIGYKTKEMYIFFSEKEISIYRIDKQNNEEFNNLLEKYVEDSDFQSFTNQLTTIWPDYDNYISNENGYELCYTLKGIKIQVSSANKDGIHIYSNYQDANNEKLKNMMDTGKVYFDTDENLVYLNEINRIAEQRNRNYFYDSFYEYEEKEKNLGNSQLFSYYIERYDDNTIEKIRFLSQNGEYANNELKANINTYAWLNDRKFIYSIAYQGIYIYDPIERTSEVLIEQNEEFNIQGIEEGNILKYDDKKVKIEIR